jgi:hypothetical protein
MEAEITIDSGRQVKVCVMSAIFGGVDIPRPMVDQSLPEGAIYQRFIFTEQNTPFPLPNLPERLQAKYFKCNMHEVKPGYDVYVWVDGNVEVTDHLFLGKLIAPLFLGNTKVTIQKHHERNTIQEEIQFILESNNPYLTIRYGKQPLADEYAWYKAHGMPDTTPLYSCNIFAYSNRAKAVELMREWWALCLQWSWFDQSAFSYLAWKHQCVGTVDLGGVVDSPLFRLHSHAIWNK